MSDKVVRCQACGSPFVFRRKSDGTGRPNPINTTPDPKGNIAVLPNGTYRILLKDEDYNGPRYTSHFTDCPAKASFRR